MNVRTYRSYKFRGLKYWFDRVTGRPINLDREPKIKIDPWDTWNIDHTLSPIILALLKQYKETAHGHPANFTDYYENQWKSRQQYDRAVMEGKIIPGGQDTWKKYLDMMIWSFEQLTTDFEDQFHSGEIDMFSRPCEDNPELTELAIGPNDTHKFDREGYDNHVEKIKEGLHLFAEYFMTLWD